MIKRLLGIAVVAGVVMLLGVMSTPATAGLKANERLGKSVENIVLRDYRGKEVSLAEFGDKKFVVLAFLGTECPLAKLYAPRLVSLAKEYESKGVSFVGVSSTQTDSVTELASFARVNEINFPILKDANQQLMEAVGAERTPEIVVLDSKRTVRYVGRVDDQYGFTNTGASYQQNKPRRRDLGQALDELLAGKTPTVATTKVQGCLITKLAKPNPAAEITYSKQISRIMNERCVSCHRPGQIGPFPLRTYDEVVGWAEMIKEVVSEGRMPPWHADPQYGKFINDCRLGDEQKALINRWVADGAPEGDKKDLPTPPTFNEKWQIPEPDQVISMAEEFECPADGTVEYQRFFIDPGWKEDKWIKHVECRPSNPSIVHHIIVYLRPPTAARNGRAGKLTNDWLAAYAPGLRVPDLADGLARFAPAGSQLIFEVHYTPNGVKQKDRSFAGFVFADPKTIKKEVAVKNAGAFDFKIPAHAENHEVKSTYNFKDDTLLISVSPHMHLRGKDFKYEILYPNGKQETILWVPRYDFGWQTTYTFTEPMKLPKGTKMFCTAHFDNSEGNLANPDPNQDVRWGEQTWEEMMFGWFEMALEKQDLSKPQTVETTTRLKDSLAAIEAGADKDNQLAHLAKMALKGKEDFSRFVYMVEHIAPQVDRVCVTYIEDNKLHLLYSMEKNGLKSTFTSSDTVYPVKNNCLADAANSDKETVCTDLSKGTGQAIRKLATKGVRSSVHFPIKLNGKAATVNFWSTDEAAFTPPVVKALVPFAQSMANSH